MVYYCFFLLSVLNSFPFMPVFISQSAKAVSGQFEIIALAAIGMRAKFRALVKEGPKSMLYGGLIGMSQVLFAILLIFILFR